MGTDRLANEFIILEGNLQRKKSPWVQKVHQNFKRVSITMEDVRMRVIG